MMFCLWTRQSEYNRVEVLYDVLLPWLVVDGGKDIPDVENPTNRLLFSEAIMANEEDPFADWRTPQRSETSAYRSVHDGLRYYLRSKGVSNEKVKQLSFALRHAFVISGVEELLGVSENFSSELVAKASQAVTETTGLQKPEEEDEEGEGKLSLNLSEVFPMLSANLVDKQGRPATLDVQGKVIALYFSAHWCPPCRHFTPRLGKSYESRKNSRAQQGLPQDFEVIFVSADKSKEEFNNYFSQMAFPFAVNFDGSTRTAVSNHLNVMAYPTLILFDDQGEIITTKGTQCFTRDPSMKNFPWKRGEVCFYFLHFLLFII